LIGRKGTIDAPRYCDQPFWTVDTLFYTELIDNNSAKFMYYKFCMIPWRNYNEASGVPSLSARTIENIKIVLPNYEEQEAIAAALSDIDTETQALEQRRCKTAELKQGMMQELLTGRTRLV
jgi:type I restriction enzyme S subunit